MAAQRLSGAALLMGRLDEELTAAADPARAPAMQAYMRDQFTFLGVPSPGVREAVRASLRVVPRPDQDTLTALAMSCWDRPQREYQYAACHLLRQYTRVLDSGFLPSAQYLITTKPWWDTVDLLAAHVVGALVARDPALVAVMDAWVSGDELWLIRTALLHQLRYKSGTDSARLLRYCSAQAGHPDFFIRKAIGWALREHARSDPETVRTYVDGQGTKLSALSRREALKHLG